MNLRDECASVLFEDFTKATRESWERPYDKWADMYKRASLLAYEIYEAGEFALQ